MHPLIQVALGGALGAVARYAVVTQGVRLLGPGFPWGTLTVNLVGSFVMGVLAALLVGRGTMAPLLLSGMLGGFTTYSAFSLDTVMLMERGQWGLAAVYVLGTVLGAIGGCALGLALARGALA